MKDRRTMPRWMAGLLIMTLAGGCAGGRAGRRDTVDTAVMPPPPAAQRAATAGPAAAGDASIEDRYAQLLAEVRRMEQRSAAPLPPPPREALTPSPPPLVESDNEPPPPLLPAPDEAVVESPDETPPPLEPSVTEPSGTEPAAAQPSEVALPVVETALPAPADDPDRRASTLTIQPEAVLRIRVREDPSLDGQYAVNDIGAVNLGYVGPIILFNHTEAQAAEKIREVLVSREFRNATVSVEILRASYDRVSVGGQVNRPGLIRIGAGDTISLNDALLRAGGLRGSVRGLQVRVLRGGVTNVLSSAQEGDVYSLQADDGVASVPAVRLGNNDKVIVFSSQTPATMTYGAKEILVLGEVHRPGTIRFGEGEPSTMMHLVFKIGGFPQYANRRNIRIIRRDDNGREHEFTVNVEEILETGDPDLDVPLEHGDRVIVPARRISLF